MTNFDIIATTQFGLEEILASELNALGASDIEILNRSVKFRGDTALMYKCNLYLRTALKVLKPIAIFEAHNEKGLYDGIQKIDWSRYLTTEQTFAIDGTAFGEVITHSKFLALKSKDAIVDQFREKTGIRPSIDIEDPDLRINVHVSDVTCSVALDSSGMPLSKRGYRHERTLAPISEVLAAGIILLSGWDQKSDFYDPMCGSGTFSIEAALIARNIPFSRFRHFSFEKWNDFDPGLWEQVQKEAEEQVRAFEGRIFGSDMDRKAVEISVQNARRAGVEGQISFKKNDFLSSTPEGEPGVVVLNPPYGERLQSDDIIAFYKEIGTRLKHYYNGCDAWIISANLDALKFIGLKPSRKIKLFNGQLECRLNKYELYRGSKKQGDLMA